MKSALRLIITASLLIFSHSSFAQYPGMSAVRAQQSRQFASQQMRTMQMNGLRGAYYSDNAKYTFIVTMSDSSKKEVYSKIYMDTTIKKMYLLSVDKSLKKSDTNRNKKIFPSQTVRIARSTYVGTPSDSCWMFKVVSGPITAYSYLSDEDGQMFDQSTLIGISLNDGPIQKFSADKLKEIIGQNDVDALQIAMRGNYMRAMKRYNRDNNKPDKK